ncbi:MAG: VWA domain-containing protein [Gaiellales bacterium]
MAAPGDVVLERMVGFGRVLRSAGLEVGPGRLQDALRGLDVVGLGRRDDVYHTLRATLVARREEMDAFDAAFAAYWEEPSGLPQPDAGIEVPRIEPSTAPPVPAPETDGAGDDSGEESTTVLAASPDERLRRRDFADMTATELRRLRRLMERLPDAAPKRRSRRLRASTSGNVLDARRTLRRAIRTQGLPLDPAFRRRKQVPRKVVFLCDVSGSMEPYARAIVMFLQAVTVSGRSVEAFAFGTRITRLTPHLKRLDPARSLAGAGGLMPDWGGGTRIGESLRSYNDVWGRRGLTRGAVVVIVSDGWERGDLALLDGELARISRQAHRLVWVNPLKGHAGFAPLAGGMRVALRHSDVFVEGHNLVALEALADRLAERRLVRAAG